MKARILLIEDEPGLVLTLCDLLESEGYRVDKAYDGPSGETMAKSGEYDLLVLDVMLPGRNGFEVLRELRAKGNSTPVIMLTARAATTDKIVGLKCGADDYLAKPFDSLELLARIEAIFRRSRGQKPSLVYANGLSIDLVGAKVMRDQKEIALTAQEWRLLSYLAIHGDQTVAREQLLESVWKYSDDITSRTVDVHVASLRQKLELNPSQPVIILTIRGLGYRFVSTPCP